MVADLLGLGHHGKHVAPPLDPFGVLDLQQHLVDDRLVQRGLLGGELAVLLDLDLLGQIVDDRRVGLEPAHPDCATPGIGSAGSSDTVVIGMAHYPARSVCGVAKSTRLPGVVSKGSSTGT
jgi:hypothetical protein